MPIRALTLAILFTVGAFAQSTDISGWAELPWGTAKSAALKTLQPLGARECKPSKDPSCAESAGADVVILQKFNFNNVPFTVHLLFTAKTGLSRAFMTGEDKRGAFEKILSTLTLRYGKPGLQSEYDGESEQTRTSWIWAKPHGKLSLETEETNGIFTLTYQPRP